MRERDFGKLSVSSRYQVIEQSNLDKMLFEDVLRCPRRREQEETFKKLIGIRTQEPQRAMSEPPVIMEWNANDKDGERSRGVRNRNSHQVRGSICLKHGHTITQCPTKSCSLSGERGSCCQKLSNERGQCCS